MGTKKKITAKARSKGRKKSSDATRPSDHPDDSAASSSETSAPLLAVVGIGASAGGLDALKQFFTAMPADSNAAFILIQHLDPDHDSILAELLSRCTTMPVVQAEDKMAAAPNCAYVIPPNKYLTIRDSVLHLEAPTQRRGMRLSIDHFFHSLAVDQEKRAVGVILSGTGSDGTLGIKAIKEHGGMVMVQEPQGAAYDGMPRSAIATGQVDYVLPVAEMPACLSKYLRHPYVNGNSDSAPVHETPNSINAIINSLLSATKHDFHYYKRNMLVRRIERRMSLHHIDTTAEYQRFLRHNPDEVQRLFRDLLIGVTSFFRDPEAFAVLEDEVIPRLMASKGADDTVRVWVPGCATGEEAYSMAILLMDHMAVTGHSASVQIFATDIDERALDTARAAVYPASCVADVSAVRLSRYFKRDGETFRVKKELREKVVFAVQNVITDPPFSRLDLISCRNMLIYLEPAIQKRIIQLFHFAIRDTGYLFLGASETLGTQDHLFTPISKKWRIYRRLLPSYRPNIELPMFLDTTLVDRHPTSAAKLSETRNTRDLTCDALLDEYAPPSVLVDQHYEILYVYGDTGAYLTAPPGQPTHNLLAMARDGLRGRLRAALHKAVREHISLRANVGQIAHDGTQVDLTIRVTPLEVMFGQKLYLVCFEASEACVDTDLGELSESAMLQQLETELEATQEDLHSTIEELETSNEELRASNEEVMSMNEELQSTNEELETSKEELQSLNEELNTVNNQLQDKLEELEAMNNDLANLLRSTDIATIFLDKDLNIKRFTPAITRLMKVIARDVGRPITDIARMFEDEHLVRDAHSVVDSALVVEREVRTDQGRWYLRRILPYRIGSDHVNGIVITFSDIDTLKHAEEELRQAHDILEQRVKERTRDLERANQALREEIMQRKQTEHTLQSILDTTVDGIISIDEKGIIESCNKAAETIFQYGADEMMGQNVKMLMPSPYADEHDEYLARYLRTGNARIIGVGREVRGRRKDGTEFPLDLAVGERRDQARGNRFTGVVRDISARKQLEEEFRQAQKMEAVGRLSSGIAHDFNNLLMGVLGCADHILRVIEADSPARPMAEELKRAVKHGSQITRQLLTFARKREGEPELLDLDRVLDNMQTMLRHIVGEEVSLEIRPSGTGKWVRCDPVLMEQAVMNLVLNARDAIASSGHIYITVTELMVDAAFARDHGGIRRGPYMVVTIEDSGHGMDEATRARMFEPFFTTKGETQGTGLGLATVYSMVQQCNGHIEVDSAIGEGTTIRIYYPVVGETTVEPGSVAGAPEMPVGGTECVLLAEDEELVRQAVRGYLEGAGYRVMDARTGNQALALWEEHQDAIDLLLTDIVLPELSGTELAERVYHDRPDVSVVFMSAYPEKQLVEEGRIPAGSSPLQKPFARDDLLRCVRTTLDKRARSKRVLVVEDTEVARRALCDLLDIEGFDVVEAATMAAAEEQLREAGQVDILLTDLKLPDGIGTTLAKTMRTQCPGLMVLFLSGASPEDPVVASALQIPGAAFVQKPADIDEILAVIAELARNHLKQAR